MRLLVRALAFGSACALSVASMATDLTLTGLADDFFVASVSTDPSLAGSTFLEQVNTWQSGAVTGSITLTPGVTNYLNIAARDAFGAPSMFIGEASLSDALFSFNDGSQFILTDTGVNWTASLAGFGGAPEGIIGLGANGTGPWGFNSGIDANAQRIWTNGAVPDVRYFQVQINAVPEPGLMAAAALGGLALLRRRRS
jgi:MYXO-CTERM domain-containing protein